MKSWLRHWPWALYGLAVYLLASASFRSCTRNYVQDFKIDALEREQDRLDRRLDRLEHP